MSRGFLKGRHKYVCAPTLLVSDTYKQAATTPKERGRRVTKLNKCYMTLAACIWLSVAAISLLTDYFTNAQWTIGLLCGYSLSRCNEVFLAFVKDVFDKLDPDKRDKNGLEYFERIQLALRSYIELMLHYSLLYYLIGMYCIEGFLNRALSSLWEALYFSAVTIVTLGYGDIYPVHPLAQGLVVYEVINGMLLLAVSFTVYVNLTLDE